MFIHSPDLSTMEYLVAPKGGLPPIGIITGKGAASEVAGMPPPKTTMIEGEDTANAGRVTNYCYKAN